jgi:histidinol phosphatase-like PHP family hydrolase
VCEGDSVRKTVSRVLSIALALGFFASSGGFAHASPGAGGFETNSKKTRKAYLKHQKMHQKKFNKNAKKQQKELRKEQST